MAVSFEKVKAGDRLWDCHKHKTANTTMSRMGAWPVDVISIDHEKGEAVVSWNHNENRTVRRGYFRSLRRTPAQGTYERDRIDAEKARGVGKGAEPIRAPKTRETGS